jgi:hypothetical protein
MNEHETAKEFAGKYIAAALFSSPTIDKELITVLPNVRYKEVIQKFDFTNLIGNAACDFGNATPASMSIDERVLTTEEFQTITRSTMPSNGLSIRV